MNTGLIASFVVSGICLLVGSPVAFSVGIGCMASLTVNDYPSLGIAVQRMASGAKSFNMMAMPMLIFVGSLMVYGSIPCLMGFANIVLRKMPDGLGTTALVTCGFFGAISGSGVTGTAAVGKIIGPEVLERGYPRRLIVGLIVARGTMTCIIPPSVVMAAYTSPSGVSVGDMFLTGLVPGFICIIALIGFNTSLAVRKGSKESVKRTDYTARGRPKTTDDAPLPLLMPILVLGGVFSGTRTAMETSVVAVICSFILAVLMYREPTLREFYKVATEGAVTTGVIIPTISVATPFGWIISIQNVSTLFANWLPSITSSKFLIVTFMFLLLLLSGAFMETMCIIILVTPTLLSIARAPGMGVVHYRVPMLMVLTIGSPTPPLFVNLFMAYWVLSAEYDEVFSDTLWVTLTMTACALLTLVVPEITELLPAALK